MRSMYCTMFFKGDDHMIARSASRVRQHFKEICDTVTNDFETVIVTRERGENVVLMSEAEYNNLMENLFVRQDPEAYKQLIESINQLKKGKGKRRELIDE